MTDDRAVPIAPLPAEHHGCDECRVAYPSIDVESAKSTILGIPAAVHAIVTGLTDEQLRSRPDDRTWSVVEYVCHLRDVYATYTIRLHRTRVERTPVLEPMLNDLRARRFRYIKREVGPVVAELADNVAGLLDETERFSDDGWERSARRLPGEERTARWLLRQAMHEGSHHVLDISTILARLEADRVSS